MQGDSDRTALRKSQMKTKKRNLKFHHVSYFPDTIPHLIGTLLGDMCSWRPLSPGWDGVEGAVFLPPCPKGEEMNDWREFLGSIYPLFALSCSYVAGIL